MFKHTKEAVQSANPMEGFSGWDLDKFAAVNNWQGVGLLPVTLTRDSDALGRANWSVAFNRLREQFGEDSVEPARFGHWAVGWVELGTFDTGRAGILEAVEGMRKELEDYPVLDEDVWSEYEWEDNHPWDGVCYSEDDGCHCGNDKD